VRFWVTLAFVALVSLPAEAPPAQARPVLVELYTSQACSSCPPADALLAALQQTNKDILPLSFNVTYWNSPAWTDGDSLAGATARQSWYVGLVHSDTVYTPEAVVDGDAQMVGSDRLAVTAAILAARRTQRAGVPVSLNIGAGMLTISVGPGKTAQPDTIWLFGFDPAHTTRIGGGENGGAILTEINVVRSITSLGSWSGQASTYHVPAPQGAHVAAVLQRNDGSIDGLGLR